MKVRITEIAAVFMIAGILLMGMGMPLGIAASQIDINTAIEKGLAYLNSTQASDGSWGSNYAPVACTAMAVLAFENAPNSHYGWNLTDPYHATVQKGLDYLFTKAFVQVLTNQTAGNPDTNGNGIGIDFYSYNVGYPHYTDETYQTPMVLMAIVASQNKTQIATTGPVNVTGRSYYDIAVDIVDWIAYAQNDASAGSGRGGWRYTANFGSSDNSVSQWPILGFMAAQLWGINAPSWVRNELTYWIAADQDLNGNNNTNSNYGSFGYTGADTINGGVLETATGILELSYIGAPSNNASVIAAEGYINRMWNYYDASWNVNMGSLYGMYAVMKAMRETIPTPTQFIANFDGTPGVEWYNGTGEYADALIANQAAGGSWVNWKNWAEPVATDLSTAWGVLILEFVPVRVEYTLTVHVVDANTSNSISGANVVALGPQNLSGVTDGGTVVFNDTQAGSYVVTASKPGYTSASVNVSLTNDTETTIKLISLTPPTRELKKDAIAELEAAKLLTTNKHTKEKIDQAIKEINESLNPSLWVDDLHLNAKHGFKVFDEEKDAVGKLMDILRQHSNKCRDDNNNEESTAVNNITQAVIDKLLRVDQLLADTAIKDAKALDSTDCRVIHAIKEANEEFSEALHKIKKGEYSNAVEEFKHAWMHAEHAITKKFGDLNCDGKVDMKDLMLALKAYGSREGDPAWTPLADIRGVGKIGMSDIVTIIANFGNQNE